VELKFPRDLLWYFLKDVVTGPPGQLDRRCRTAERQVGIGQASVRSAFHDAEPNGFDLRG